VTHRQDRQSAAQLTVQEASDDLRSHGDRCPLRNLMPHLANQDEQRTDRH
jgi:hypothetical protein